MFVTFNKCAYLTHITNGKKHLQKDFPAHVNNLFTCQQDGPLCIIFHLCMQRWDGVVSTCSHVFIIQAASITFHKVYKCVNQCQCKCYWHKVRQVVRSHLSPDKILTPQYFYQQLINAFTLLLPLLLFCMGHYQLAIFTHQQKLLNRTLAGCLSQKGPTGFMADNCSQQKLSSMLLSCS